jgi:hypothetical protein
MGKDPKLDSASSVRCDRNLNFVVFTTQLNVALHCAMEQTRMNGEQTDEVKHITLMSVWCTPLCLV